MIINRKFNTFSKVEYFFYIDNYKKYKDFNTLGLYHSIIENEKLTLNDRIEVREYAHKLFVKTFEFLQLKDPKTYKEVHFLGLELTEGDEEKIWSDIVKNQQRILADKRIKHRNFGFYSKHNCGYDTCVWNGVMVRQGSWLAEDKMHFNDDNRRFLGKVNAHERKSARKRERLIINRDVELD